MNAPRKFTRGFVRRSRRAIIAPPQTQIMQPMRRRPRPNPQRYDGQVLAEAKSRSFAEIHNTEPVAPITVPSNSVRGDLLYSVEVNPQMLGRILAANATQAQSWAGNVSFIMRVNGSVNSTNYAVARWLPDADLSELPTDKEARWRYVRANSTGLLTNKKKKALDRAFIKYNVVSEQSESQQTVNASWVQSYNPIKPIRDDNASTQNLGLFVIVSNGPPGEEITIDLDCKYDVYFCGPAPRDVLLNNSLRAVISPVSPSVYFGTITSDTGPGSFTYTSNSYTLPAGNYLISHTYQGTGIASNPIKTVTAGCTFANSSATGTATIYADMFYLKAPTACTVTMTALPATTFTSWTLNVAMSTGNV